MEGQRDDLSLGFELDLVVDGEMIDFFNVPYGYSAEPDALEAVFPREHWSLWNEHANDWFDGDPKDFNTPPAFDFIANEEKAKEVMGEYHESITTWTDGTVREDTSGGAKPRFEEEFWRVYNLGMSLQREGKVPRVIIG